MMSLFRVQGSRFRGSGCWVLGAGCSLRVLGTGYWCLVPTRTQIPNPEVLGSGFRVFRKGPGVQSTSARHEHVLAAIELVRDRRIAYASYPGVPERSTVTGPKG